MFPHTSPALLAAFIMVLTFNQLPVVDFHLFCHLLLDGHSPEDLLGGLGARRHKHVHQDTAGAPATPRGGDFIRGLDLGF